MATYATVAQFREYRPQTTAAKVPDPLVTQLLERAHDLINKALGFQFEAWGDPATRKVRGKGTPYLALPAFKEGSITGVVCDYDGDAVDADEWEEDGDALYRVDGQGNEGNWGRYRYTVTGIWGYGPAPAAIVELELELAVNIWKSAATGSFTNVIGVEGGGGVGYEGAMTPLQRKAIALVRAKHNKAYFA